MSEALETSPYAYRRMQFVAPASGSSLMHALACGELAVFHQPKLDCRKGIITGTEALLRWEHPKRGLLAPNAFASDLCALHDDLRLFTWVLHESLTHCRQWLAQGFALSVSVNVTPADLLHPEFLELIQECAAYCRCHGLPIFGLELVECGPVTDIDRTIKVLEVCAQCGVMLALDDFGTGYSTMTLLQRLPAPIMKIDRSFVSGIISNATDRKLLATMLDMAASLGKTVVAEGVETKEHASELNTMGCSILQGYGISGPIRSDSLCGWIMRSISERCWWTTLGTGDWLSQGADLVTQAG